MEPLEPRIHHISLEDWEDFKQTVREGRRFAEEARGYALEARDSSRSNNQTMQEVVRPAIDAVEEHEKLLQHMKGALWAFTVVWTIAVGVLGVYVTAH